MRGTVAGKEMNLMSFDANRRGGKKAIGAALFAKDHASIPNSLRCGLVVISGFRAFRLIAVQILC